MFNIVRIEAGSKKKHIVHPGYETQEAAKKVLKDMVKAHLKQGHVVLEFALSFTTPANQDIYMIEDKKYLRV